MKTISPNKSPFFDIAAHPSEPLFAVKVNMSLGRRIQNCLAAKLKILPTFFELTKRSHDFKHQRYNQDTGFLPLNNEGNYSKESFPWNKNEGDSEGLFLFIHGLKQNPLMWQEYMDEVKASSLSHHCAAPEVIKGGNCSLEEASEPLIEIIKDYIQKHPGKPIHIIGTSNGGRLAQNLESRLPELMEEGTPLAVVSIAGLHYGTQIVTHRYHIDSFLGISKVLKKEFPWKSSVAQSEMDKWNVAQEAFKSKNIRVRHLFCATLNDELVKSNASSLPRPRDSETECSYMIFDRHSHLSVVKGAREDVLAWLKI